MRALRCIATYRCSLHGIMSPTLQFLLGVWLFHEAFTADRLVGFVLIWLALALFAAEGLLNRPQPVAKEA